MRIHLVVPTIVSIVCLAGAATAQQLGQQAAKGTPAKAPRLQAEERLDAVDHAERMARIAITGDLGFPPLPPVYSNSPKSDLLYADRFPVGSGETSPEAGDGSPAPVIVNGFIPSGPNGTGTAIGEIFRYQLPVDYDEQGAPVPMVIAYHGYGSSAGSVHPQTTIDEEANARGWFYMAPTGLDDQLFGTPPSQQNTKSAIQWMLDNFNIDEDRLYMVGFSMGGGVVSNFAARHRDPDGLMIAAIGVVAGTYDWEQAYNTGTTGLKALMENPYNFGGPPFAQPFRYRQASDLRFQSSTYPPLPGTLDPPSSMAVNLGSTPTYLVWDDNDTIVDVLNQGPHFVATLQEQGTLLDFHTVTGTVNPANGQPAPHSWSVLDEVDLFDFFDGKTVDRTPEQFSSMLDLSKDVSWLHLDQRFLDMFSYVDGAAEPGANALTVDAVANATYVEVDMGLAGFTGAGPFDAHVASATGSSFQLRLTGFDVPPAYTLDAGTGLLHPGTESNPLTGSLLKPIVGLAPVDLQVVCDPAWTTKLTTTPNPTAPGASLMLELDAPDTSTIAWLVIGFSEGLSPIKGGHKLSVALGPPAVIVAFVLDEDGDISFPAELPNDGGLSGTSLLLQTIAVDGGFSINSISNRWTLKIQ